MGLDMYVLKTTDITKDRAEKCRGMKLDEIDTNEYSWYFADSLDGDISKHCHKMQCLSGEVNLERIKADNNIPEDFYLFFTAMDDDGKVRYGFSGSDSESVEISLSNNEIKQYTEYSEIDVWIGGPMKQFYYWRKAYDIANLFDRLLYEPAENCGFYCLDAKALEGISKADYGFAAKLKSEHDDNAVYVYHPWW